VGFITIDIKILKERENMRECQDCSLCCKLPEINDLEYHKKSFLWCKSCNIEKGNCKVYENRPLTCRTFECFYLQNKTDLKPNEVGFFVFTEQHLIYEHGDQKIRTIYCEPKKLKDLIKNIKKDKKLSMFIKLGYAFHIRYNENDKHIKIYDPNTFGEKLVFFHKGWTNEKLNEVIESEKLKTVNA
jgi:Fe-S-cluster containining protein|tara:strand:- start:1308 stop:1865 length:558 start_codon:yes stop_codon:yes gene_type:complete